MSFVVKDTSGISLTISESVSSSSPRLGLVGTHQILLFVMKASKHHQHLCLLEEFHICQMNTSLLIKVTVVIDDGDGSITEKASRLVIKYLSFRVLDLNLHHHNVMRPQPGVWISRVLVEFV